MGKDDKFTYYKSDFAKAFAAWREAKQNQSTPEPAVPKDLYVRDQIYFDLNAPLRDDDNHSLSSGTEDDSFSRGSGSESEGIESPDELAGLPRVLQPRRYTHSFKQSPRKRATPRKSLTGQFRALDLSDPDETLERTPKSDKHALLLGQARTRLERKRIEAEAAKDQYRIVPLSSTHVAKVRASVHNGLSYKSHALSPTDLQRCAYEFSPNPSQDRWLNDETINAYLQLICDHGTQNDRPTQVKSHHAFNSFFYTTLAQKGYEGVKRWAKRAKIGGSDLLQTKLVFIPINQSMHWTLATIEAEKKKVTVYNSMGRSKGELVCRTIMLFIAAELGSAFKESEWTSEPAGYSPQQTNGNDCGVFTITNARQIMLGKNSVDGKDGKGYRESDIMGMRRRVVAELGAGGLITARDS